MNGKTWKKHYLGEAFPHDEFRPAGKGPIPVHLWEDLRRLEKKGIVTLDNHQWGKTKAEASLRALRLFDINLMTNPLVRSPC